jgi:hypothetical protein
MVASRYYKGIMVFSFLADLAPPPGERGISSFYPPGSHPTPTNFITSALLVSVLKYILATLVFELPVFYFLGFKSKRAIAWVVVVNIISVSVFHLTMAYCSTAPYACNFDVTYGSGLILAEVVITLFEALVLLLALRKTIAPRRIILATILANAVSAILGGFIVNTLLGGF